MSFFLQKICCCFHAFQHEFTLLKFPNNFQFPTFGFQLITTTTLTTI